MTMFRIEVATPTGKILQMDHAATQKAASKKATSLIQLVDFLGHKAAVAVVEETNKQVGNGVHRTKRIARLDTNGLSEKQLSLVRRKIVAA